MDLETRARQKQAVSPYSALLEAVATKILAIYSLSIFYF